MFSSKSSGSVGLKRSLSLGIVFAACSIARAGDVNWTGGSGTSDNWSDTLNWLGFNRPNNNSDDTAYFFAGSGRTRPNINQDYAIGSIVFSSQFGSATAYTLTGTGTLGLSDEIDNFTSNTQTIAAPIQLNSGIIFDNYLGGNHHGKMVLTGPINLNGYTLTCDPSTNGIEMSGVISGTGDLEHSGPGTLKLSAANTFEGDVEIYGGELEFSAGSNLGQVGNRVFLMSDDSTRKATLRRTTSGTVVLPIGLGDYGGTIDTPAGTSLTLAGMVGFASGATANASLVKAGSGILTIQGWSNYVGSTILEAGTLRLPTNIAATPLVVKSAAAVELSSDRTYAVTELQLNTDGTIDLLSNAKLRVGTNSTSSDGDALINGTIRGTGGSFEKRGIGAAIINSANTYTGGTNLVAGTTFVTNTTGSATGSGAVTIQSTATLSGNGIITGSVSALGGSTIRPGNLFGKLRTGPVDFSPGSRLHARIGGAAAASVASIDATGTIDVGQALLKLEILNNYLPVQGATFDIAAGVTITGRFASIEGVQQTGMNDLRLAVTYVDGILDAIRVRATLAGDVNFDDRVNFDDMLVLAQQYNASGTRTWADGDFDGNASVDFGDLLVLAQSYNSSSSSFAADWVLATQLAPEPALLPALVGSTALVRRRRGTHQSSRSSASSC